MSTLVDQSYRYELKFEMNRETAQFLKYRLALFMHYDPFAREDGSYYVRSLYFDDIYNTSYYEKMNGVKKRQKYRIRFYNFDQSYIILELKGKDGNLGYKKQNKITFQEYYDLIYQNYDRINMLENRSVLSQFIIDAKTKNLVPSIIVDYKRVAYSYPVHDVRITFDSDICSGGFNDDFFNPNIMLLDVLEKDKVILEVKYNKVLPKVIQELLSSVPMVRISLSKFVLCREMKGDL